MLNNNDMLMDWDDAIENDGQEFVILPEGDYNFTVTDFERGRFPGSAKIPACNKATLTLQVNTADGIAAIKTDLILYRSLEWRISAFFRCIGQKKHGERLVMNPKYSALISAEPNGGTPIPNWSTIETDARLSAAIVDRFSASVKTAPGNTVHATATLQNASMDVNCNDA